MRFYAKSSRVTSEKKGCWDYSLIEIFQKDGESVSKIGEYTRNYSSHGEATFFPFEVNGKWYALYSKNYTATRVMTLPDCKDLCGEQNDQYGFCPVEYYVPRYQIRFYKTSPTESESYRSFNEESFKPNEPIYYYDTAFLAGCVWGDDSSWKIEAIDLSNIEKGEITRFQPFGYHELPNNLSLKESITMSSYGENESFEVASQKTFYKKSNGKYSTSDDNFVIEKGIVNRYGQLILIPKHYDRLEIRSDKNELKKLAEVYANLEIDPEHTLAKSFIGKTKTEAEEYFKANNKKYMFVEQEHEGFVSYPSQISLPRDFERFYCTLKKGTEEIFHVTYL